MTPDELVEEVARDMWWETHTMPWFAANEGDRSRMLRQARAAITVALEQAAMIVEFSPDSHTAREMQLMLDKAAAIRALIKEPT